MACLPALCLVIYLSTVCYGCHVCRAINVLVVSGQLLHLLLMERLTGNKLNGCRRCGNVIEGWGR